MRRGPSLLLLLGTLSLPLLAAALPPPLASAGDEAKESARRDRAAAEWLQENVTRFTETPMFRPRQPLAEADVARRLRRFLREHADTRPARHIQEGSPGQPWETFRRILAENPAADEEIPSDAHLAKTRRLLGLSSPTRRYLDEAIARWRSARGVASDLAAKIEELFDPEALLDVIAPIYARHVDERVVDALLAFHESPEGRLFADALPAIETEVAEAIEAWAKALLERVKDELRRERAARIPLRVGVHIGDGLLFQEMFAEMPRLGVVHDIRLGDLAARPGREVGIAATLGAVIGDAETQSVIVTEIEFASRARGVGIVDVEGDGTCEFLERRSGLPGWGGGSKRARNWNALDLLDHQGRVRWSYGGEHEAHTSAAADLDGDGTLEFVVGFADGHGLHVVDRHGDLVRSMPEERVWHVEVADLDGDGAPEIVHSDAEGRLKIRNARGEVLRRLTLASPVRRFSISPWPTRTDPARILVGMPDGRILLLDVHGDTVRTLSLPRGLTIGEGWGTPVAFREGKKPQFALLSHDHGGGPSILDERGAHGFLCVFDPEGELVFLEVLEEPGRALLPAPRIGAGGEQLFVGGRDRVWAFWWREVPERSPSPPSDTGPPAPPDAGRAMREILGALAGLPVRLVDLDVTAKEARFFVQAAETAAFDRARISIERGTYFKERARDTTAVVELGPEFPAKDELRRRFTLHFREGWAEASPLHEAGGISRENVRPAARLAGVLLLPRGDPYRDTDWKRYDTLYRGFVLTSEDRNPSHMTLGKLELFLEALAEGGTYRATELQWRRWRISEEGDAADVIRTPRVTVAGWRRIPERP